MALNLVTPFEFSKQRGVTLPRISQLISEGRLDGAVHVDMEGRRRIDSDLGHKLLDGSMDPRAATGNKAAMERMDAVSARQTLESFPDRNTQRAIKEEYQAKMTKLEYEKEAGLLVEAEKVKLSAVRIARMTRDAMLNIPDRLSSQLAAITDPFEINELLTQEIELSLQELGKLAP